ncbi:MAG TPA: LacI family DNA-binding transcriptional regulator [Roseiflexaceae bacterium]
MANAKRVTIMHVAHEAGVSYQTVSRVVNDRPDVAPETRKRVQDVIARLEYQPHAIARSLASKRTHTLGLITADFSDYFFTQVIAGAEAESRKHGYRFMLGSTERNPQDEPEYIRLLTERHVEGILFARPSTEVDNRHLIDLLRDGVPIVTTAYYLPGESLTVVDVDNLDGAYQATRHLLEYGHRQVAMITGPATWKSTHDRTLGFTRALEQAGAMVDPALIAEGDWSYPSGHQAMRALLARERSFSAVFAQNDRMAIGALCALREARLNVPQDISIVGYDDIPGAEYAAPPLTTIRQPMREVGAIATRLLIRAIEEPDAAPEEVLLRTELIRRSSCAKVGRAASRRS